LFIYSNLFINADNSANYSNVLTKDRKMQATKVNAPRKLDSHDKAKLQEMRKQITTLTPFPTFLSWGVGRTWYNVPTYGLNISFNELTYNYESKDYEVGLLFKVNGLKHKGHIFVALAWNDTYTITRGQLKRATLSNKESIYDVYFDQLPEVLNHLINGE
jgi:hypothetical protein